MSSLSEEQRQVLSIQEDTLLLAGAGAGKTSTLLGALVHDLEDISPDRLAVVTFTRVAAASLRARLENKMPGRDLSSLWIGTIDALAAKLLRLRSLEAGQDPEMRPASQSELRRISIAALEAIDIEEDKLLPWIDPDRDLLGVLLDLDEECISRDLVPRSFEAPRPDPGPPLEALRDLLEEATAKQTEALQKDITALQGGDLPSSGAWGFRRRSKKFLRAEEQRDLYRRAWIDSKAQEPKEELLRIFGEWQKARRQISKDQGIWSFAEILRRAEDLEVEPFLDKMYLDEAQDTSPAQFRFLRSLVRGTLVAVGDPNQSIYGFRGADLDNFLRETKNLDTIRLRDNYRSAPEIIRVAETLCEPLLGDVAMRPAGSKKSGQVQSFLLEGSGRKTPSPRQEAKALVPVLRHELENFSPEEITVLLRSNSDLGIFYEILRDAGLPVAARRSRGLLEEEECQDMLALLGLFVDSENEEFLLRVLSSPLVGLDPERLLDFSGDLLSAGNALGPLWQETLQEKNLLPLSEIGWILLQGYRFDVLLDLLDPTGSRRGNAEMVLDLLRGLEREHGGMNYNTLLQELRDLLAESGSPGGAEAICLQTVHQAKGEEYSCVVVPRLGRRLPTSSRRRFFLADDGQLGLALPGGLRDSTADPLEEDAVRAAAGEEARLLYVALTRAKEKLLLLGGHAPDKPLAGIVQDLPNLASLPSDPGPFSSDRPEEKDRPVPFVSPHLPRAEPEAFSWSDLVLWDRCSLRRQLQGEWGLQGLEEEGGTGARQSGLRIHEDLRDFVEGKPVDLPEEIRSVAEPLIQKGSRAEVPFAFALGDKILRGRIDLLTPGDPVSLVDWKSGEEEIWQEDYRLQRRIYALAVLQGGAQSVQSQTVYLRSGRLEQEEWSASEISMLEEETLQTIERILQEPPKPATDHPKPFCAGCPGLQVICPVASSEEME